MHKPPWKVVVPDYVAKDAAEGINAYRSGHRLITDANLNSHGNGEIIALVKDTEDANLIGAVHDLLAALKDLYEQCVMTHKHWGEGSNATQADAAIKAGLAAIAKAEGGAS